MPAVVAQDLVKRFGPTEALRGVSFEIERATVLGLLGPNGAGKTTAVRILTTLMRPDAGCALVDGIDVVGEPKRARARIGLTGQYAAVDERLTGRENLEHIGRLFHLDRTERQTRAAELLERFDVVAAADRVVAGYSGGMRRRLDIAMSLIGRPSVLFLDEPTTGLDPRSRLTMWDLIDELVRGGTTTLLTTQYLDEAERLADRIVVIDHGRVIAGGTPAELKREAGGERVEVTPCQGSDLATVARLIESHGSTSGAAKTDKEAGTVTVAVANVRGTVPAIVRLLDDAGVEVDDVVVRHPTLDDVFFQLTGRPADDNVDEEAKA